MQRQSAVTQKPSPSPDPNPGYVTNDPNSIRRHVCHSNLSPGASGPAKADENGFENEALLNHVRAIDSRDSGARSRYFSVVSPPHRGWLSEPFFSGAQALHSLLSAISYDISRQQTPG